jgi:hypothetical protein
VEWQKGEDRKEVKFIAPDRVDQFSYSLRGIAIEQFSKVLIHDPITGVIPKIDISFLTQVGNNE